MGRLKIKGKDNKSLESISIDGNEILLSWLTSFKFNSSKPGESGTLTLEYAVRSIDEIDFSGLGEVKVTKSKE